MFYGVDNMKKLIIIVAIFILILFGCKAEKELIEDRMDTLPDGYICDTLSPNTGETKGIIIANDDSQCINILGVWNVDVQKSSGADDDQYNREIPYNMLSLAMPPVLCFNNDGTGFEEYNRNRDSFTWEYIIEGDKKVGVVYRYDNDGNGWLLYLKQINDTIVFEKVAYDGSDVQYGNEFNRTIQLTQRNPYILVYFEGGIHTPYSVFVHGNTKTEEGVLYASGEPVNPNEVKSLVIHKLTGDFHIDYYGQIFSEPRFTLYRYDESFDIYKKENYAIKSDLKTLEMPVESGIYLVQVSIVWGIDEENWSAYEYFFKIEIE